ncbi:MAG: hypothetical protein AVDCRST_MAG73-3321 [uncultured Thermomicrobiales bacterium]|uniref:Uncharacterized protein n=1 Tax=uncultured Thermomicrobiales bacterium TaxID=1645740 RepID=A0A6J4US54_9BACT|nr:MAG: hypothetical protein AVDCRST_MAG73-3321 [uncultured Thermomicrobiales bacterium]
MKATTITADRDGGRDDVSTGRVFVRTCAAEWTRLWTVKSTWWFVAAATVVMVGLGTALGFEAAADPAELQGGPAWTTARYIAMPAQFAFLGLALTAVTSDYATGGIVTTLQWTPRRAVLFFARTIVTAGAAAGLGVFLAVASALAAFTTAGSALILPLDKGLDMLAAVAFVFGAGTVLAIGLGFLLRGIAGALVTAFLVMLALPLLLPLFGDWMSALAEILPGSGAVFLLLGEMRTMTKTSSVVVLLAWAIGVLLLGWLRLMRDDANR